MGKPAISVLVPNFNNCRFLELALDSILMQKHSNFEVIVVDGASTDGSVEVLRSYGDRLRWISEPDSGQSDALLKAYAMSKGPIIAWLNSDEIYVRDDTLAQVESSFLHLPLTVAVVYGDFVYIDENGTIMLQKKSHPYNYLHILRGKFIPNQPSVFFRRSALNDLGFVSQEYHYAMDFELYSRLGAKYEFRYLPLCLGGFRLHGKSKTSSGNSKEKIQIEVQNIRNKYDSSLIGKIESKYYSFRSHFADLTKYRELFVKQGRLIK